MSGRSPADDPTKPEGSPPRAGSTWRAAADSFTTDPAGTRAMLAAIVESSDDAIVGKDLHGTIMSWNAGAERLFGYTAEEAIGRPVLMLLPPERHQEEARILATLVRGDRIDHFETERVTKDGRRIHVSLSVSPIKDASGRIVGGAKIARDITPRKRYEAEREELLAREQTARTLAEAANRAKDNFLAMISHELRTPLSPILAWSRMLRRGLLDDEKVRRGLETIERNAHAQVQLIDDLLDISRIVAGKLRLEVRPVELADVIRNAVEVVRPAAQAKGIALHAVLDTETGTIAGDAARLQQVVWNLLSNAVKFTPKGGHVQITLERVNSHVEIAVSDDGIGIAPEFLPHLFERFQQAQTGPTRAHGGLGLGLAIVRHIVELHGGTVVAESAGEGRGATFTVKLPLVIFARTAAELDRRHPTLGQAGDHAPYPSLAGIRMLVVDDEPDSNDVVCAVLASCGAETRVATSAADGLAALRHWTPDVIVSDIGMPGEDGYTFIRQVRALPDPAAQLPAVALTAYATTEDRVRIFSAGFQAHVVKPLDPAELVAVIASVAHRVRCA
jgi:PAS domain S-box-containing protein